MSTTHPSPAAMRAAMALYPSGVAHYTYDSEEKNEAARNRDWLVKAAIIDAEFADADLAEAKRLIEAMMKDAPRVQCNDLHHKKSDQHTYDQVCMPLARFEAAHAEARAFLAR